ncbi:MAG: hypothetical protein V2B18_01465 [Pseudomonadota bacterium]
MSGKPLQLQAHRWNKVPSDKWTITASEGPDRRGDDDSWVTLEFTGDSQEESYIETKIEPVLETGDFEELRFWFMSNRPAGPSGNHPFYVKIGVAETNASAPNFVWKRALPVTSPDRWELHRLKLRAQVHPRNALNKIALIRLCNCEPGRAFKAAMGGFVLTRPEPITDVETALLERLNNRFPVLVQGKPTRVPAVVGKTYQEPLTNPVVILITPWSVRFLGKPQGSVEVVDNYEDTGACVRPAPWEINLDYCIRVQAAERAHSTQILEQILFDLGSRPYLWVNGEALSVEPFHLSLDQCASLVPLGEQPLFYRVTSSMEAGEGRHVSFPRKISIAVDHQGRSEAPELVAPPHTEAGR